MSVAGAKVLNIEHCFELKYSDFDIPVFVGWNHGTDSQRDIFTLIAVMQA